MKDNQKKNTGRKQRKRHWPTAQFTTINLLKIK